MTTIELVANGFTRADRRRLAHALAATRLAREYRRLEAVLLVAEGRSLSESARRVRVARSSVQRWVREYLADRDADVLVDRPRTGRPRALTEAHERSVMRLDELREVRALRGLLQPHARGRLCLGRSLPLATYTTTETEMQSVSAVLEAL